MIRDFEINKDNKLNQFLIELILHLFRCLERLAYKVLFINLQVLAEAIPSTIKSVEDDLSKLRERMYMYTAALENACLRQEFSKNLDWARLKDAHFNDRQHEHFLNILMHDIQGVLAC